MREPTLHFIPAAKSDLQDIWRYTKKEWGLPQAETYVAELKRSCHTLIQSPFLGKALPDVDDGLRVFRCQHHYIFYLIEQERIVFLAFIHERRNILRHVITRLPS